MSDPMLDREARRKLAVLRHAEEVTGNVAMTCRYFRVTRQRYYRPLPNPVRRNRSGGAGNPSSSRDRRLHRAARAAKRPFAIDTIQTDNGVEFASRFHWHVLDKGIGHAYIKPHTPLLNGKAERSHCIDAEEFYRLLDGQSSTTPKSSTTNSRNGRPSTTSTVPSAD